MSAAASIVKVLALAILIGAGLVFRRLWLDLRTARRLGLNSGDFDRVARAGRKAEPYFFSFLTAFGPALVLVVSYYLARGAPEEKIYFATGAFVLAMTGSMIARLAKPSRHGRKVPWAKLLAIVMGCLTLWFRDDMFIKTRPTVQYAAGALWIMGMLLLARPRLEARLARENIPLEGLVLRKVAVTMAVLGLLMAALNELVWRDSTTGFWIVFQLWGPVLFVATFVASCFPLLRPHFPAGQCPVRTTE